MNILAVGAHPDDVEYCCAGTLAKYAAQGNRITIATSTSGNIGSATHSMDEIAKIRKSEAAASAAVIGAEYICLDYNDEMFFDDKEARLRFIDLVRYAQADVILTHNLQDYNPDHELTGKIIRDIAVMIPIAHLKTKNPPYDAIPKIFYFETACSFNFQPTDYVDITDYYDKKLQMLNCHESQKAWMRDNYKEAYEGKTDRFIDNMRITSEFRGMQGGVKYAEGFIRALDAYRVNCERVLP
jgi:LmbE family N-acetylglucosaminyl deacetylase